MWININIRRCSGWPCPESDVAGFSSPTIRWGPGVSRLTPEKISNEEAEIGRPLCQAPHEVGKPIPAEGNVNSQSVAIMDKLALQISADAVEHLKFEVVFGNAELSGAANRSRDHARIVRGETVIETARQKYPHQFYVVAIHISFSWKGDLGRLLVRALAEADAAAIGQ